MNRKIYLLILPVLGLLVLGGINIYKKITWHEPTDGVIWQQKAGNLTAVKVAINSPADLVGIKKGDILYKINEEPVNNPIDVAKKLYEAEALNQRATYELVHDGYLVTPYISVGQKGVNLLYFYLALIGLTTLIIGCIVLLNSKRPLTLPYIFFFLVSLTFYAFHIFSPTGKLDIIDFTFFWLDKTAFLVFPPLLLHFFIIFPRRKKILKNNIRSVYMLYLPAGFLLLARIFIHLPNIFGFSNDFILRFNATLDKLDLLHFAAFTLFALGMILNDTIKAFNIITKKQLKWIVYGLGFGILPFTIFYIIPFLFGQVPTKAAEFTVILQALIPLTFAYSISRYKVIDIEVILKKTVPLIFSYLFIAFLFFVVSSQTNIFPDSRLNVLIPGILAIVLGATLYTPIKKLIQSLLDRAIYKRSYKYRKTLLTISQELSRERDLQKLSQSLLDHIANALSVQYISLLLPIEGESNSFYILRSRGISPSDKTSLQLEVGLYNYLKQTDYLSEYSLSDKRDLQKKFRALAQQGFYHILPLTVEDNLIGCVGMGKKIDNTLLTLEDWELLLTISSPMALALENAYLYDQANIRASELERLKDYSENIIESLTVGVVVLDQQGIIIGWNRIMEETFTLTKNKVMGKNLAQVLGRNNFRAIFPPDTQQELRLMSEISLVMPGGSTKIFDIAKTPLLDNRMNPYGTIIVFEDTTEKISLQQQLVTSEKLASVGLLSAGVAHEINTPLTGISSYVQMLQKKMPESPQAHILKKIEAQTDRVARIVKNLLNFSRNPSDTMLHQVDLKETLQGIIALIEYKLKNLNIHLELNLASLNPIWAQGEKLQQVFINIILNALDAMPDGGTLTIDLFKKEEQALIQIRDTGTGIKSQHLPNIFDPFFTTKGIGKGTGLGLSISYAIIKEHEGQITVESEPSKGTLFIISIPMDLEKREKIKTAVI